MTEERIRCVVNVNNVRGLLKALDHINCDTRWDERLKHVQYKCDSLPFSNGSWVDLTDTCSVGIRSLIMDNCLMQISDSKHKPAKFAAAEFDKMLTYCAQQTPVDPFLMWLESLPDWDTRPRLATVLTECFDVTDDHPEQYLQYCSMLPWMTAVKRAYEPGCKADTVLVLVGDEHSGKSTYVEHMLQDEHCLRWHNGGFTWSGRSMDPKRLATEQTIGRVIVEMGEMSGLRQGEHEDLKNYLTNRRDTITFKYDKHATSVPRRFVFVGTANDTGEGILRADPGHQRRFAVIKVFNAPGKGFRRVTTHLDQHREQIWAEAIALYHSGFMDLHIHDAGLLSHMTAQARNVEQHNPLRDEVEHLLSKYAWPRAWTTKDVSEELGWSKSVLNDRAISTHLRQKGYERKRKRHRREGHSNTVSAYIPPGQEAVDAVWWYEHSLLWTPPPDASSPGGPGGANGNNTESMW